ncbi:MAG: sensor domain-containing phosphodiesterase [Nocardioidaceae bacterium]
MGTRRRVAVTLVSIALQAGISACLAGEELFNPASPARDQLLAGAALVSTGTSVALVVLAVKRNALVRRALHLREQRIAADAATTYEWLWEADLDGRITYSNDGVTFLLGYAPDEVIGRPASELLWSAADREVFVRYDEAFRNGLGNCDDIELAWRHKNGGQVWIRGSVYLMRDEAGRPVGTRGSRRRAASDLPAHRAGAHARVRELLATGGLEVALQPIVCTGTGRMVGAEALARFADGRGPETWFRDARAAGLIRELSELAFHRALGLFDVLPDDCYLSINAGPELLTGSRLADHLLAGDFPLHRLVVEVTEHAHVTDYEALCASMTRLRERGVRFAVDDTGAGYASLRHVLRLQPEVIKIDRSLIQGLAEDPARRSLVTALVLLGLDLKASVVGEGVETVEELDTMSTLGVDHLQGYLLARPSTDPADWCAWAGRTLLPMAADA